MDNDFNDFITNYNNFKMFLTILGTPWLKPQINDFNDFNDFDGFSDFIDFQ